MATTTTLTAAHKAATPTNTQFLREKYELLASSGWDSHRLHADLHETWARMKAAAATELAK
jgi:hypothetical protein